MASVNSKVVGIKAEVLNDLARYLIAVSWAVGSRKWLVSN